MCPETTPGAMRFPWIVLVVLSTALAGCSDGGDEKVDPASLCDGILQDDGTCAPHVEPRVVVEGLPDSFSAYSKVPFTWRLDNGTRGTPAVPVHSMDSRILAGTESATVTNATGPDDWGVEVAREQHQNLPGSFEATLSWDEPATLYLKGYMLIEGENVWTDLGMVDVTPVQPTGNQTTVTVSGPPPALDSTETSITVGDALVFQNDSPVDYTAVFECSNGVTVAEAAVGMQSSSAAIAFLEPTSCSYTLQSALGGAGAPDPAELSGRVNVNKP